MTDPDAVGPQTSPYPLVTAGDLPTIAPVRTAAPSYRINAGRYVVERFHARGGLGEVFVATDTELNRPVAYKRIQPQFSDHPRSRRRFVTEAVLTARLDHPGVVPVFGLVSDADGQPCYAMRFVRGETLGEQIAAAHAQSPGGDDLGSAIRRLLQRFTAVCYAIGFAHSKGVVHRDIKPANVMVGAFGEVQVMDWGLAKEVGNERPADADGSETVPAAGAADTLDGGPDGTEPDDGTLAGAVVGTPQYMAPEQAAGGAVGPAADIYSLGATLYHIVTGRPAFPRSGDLPAVLAQVCRGEYPRPRQVLPRLSKALEAVCLKAMATRPEERYATALELAADVERWLADEPVSCYREPLQRRLARWGRRHRVLVNSAGVGVLLAVAALAYSTVRVNAALARETAQKDKADRRFDQAQQAVNDYLSRVADDPRLKADDLQPLRRALLTDAQKYYADFLLERPDEPRLRGSVAAAHLRLARTYQELGQADAAGREYDAGLSGFRALLAERPGEPAWPIELARGHTALGDARLSGGGRAAARESYTEAERLLEPLADTPAAWEPLARTYTGLGRWHKGEWAGEAVAYAERAVAAHRRRAAADDLQARHDLGQSLIDLATLHTEAHRLGAAKAAYQEALGHWRAVAASGAFGFAAKAAEGRILHDLAVVQEQLGDSRGAAAGRRQALAVREATAYGHGLAYLTDLARTCNDLGVQLAGQPGAGRAEGVRLVAEGRHIREKLAALTGDPRELLMLAESLSGEAGVAVREKEFGRAAGLLQAGRAALDKLPPDHAATTDAMRARGLNQHNQGFLSLQQENIAEAEKSLALALEDRSNLVKSDTDSAQDLADLASTYLMLGNAALRTDPKRAIAQYTKAAGVSRTLERLSPEDLSAKVMHGIITYSLANAESRSAAAPDDVAALLAEALAAAQAVRQATPSHPAARQVLELGYGMLIQVRAKQGRPAAAAEAADALAEVFAGEPPKLLELARVMAALAKTAPGPDAAAAADVYGGKAVGVLGLAEKAGFADAEAVRKEPLSALAARADYQALVRRLDERKK